MGDKAYCTFRSSSGRCGPSDIIELRGKWGYKSPVYPILIRSVEDCLVSGGDALLPHSGRLLNWAPLVQLIHLHCLQSSCVVL